MRENESKRSLAWLWQINGASEAGEKKRGLFSPTVGQREPTWANRADTQRSRHTRAAVMGAEMAAVPQAISSGDNPLR